jgi:hypothetical protein
MVVYGFTLALHTGPRSILQEKRIMRITNLSKANKTELLEEGLLQIMEFAKVNSLPAPTVNMVDEEVADDISFRCGCYIVSSNQILICIKRCANIGTGTGFSQSSPASKIDRTPFGVLAHEMGHHVHSLFLTSKYFKDKHLMASSLKHTFMNTKKEKISGYEPNYRESFAESMRLFISNPDLLKRACPIRYGFIYDQLQLKPLYNELWENMLVKRGTSLKIRRKVTNWVNRNIERKK